MFATDGAAQRVEPAPPETSMKLGCASGPLAARLSHRIRQTAKIPAARVDGGALFPLSQRRMASPSAAPVPNLRNCDAVEAAMQFVALASLVRRYKPP